MRNLLLSIALAGLVLSLCGPASAVELQQVTVEGKAAGDDANARSIALTDALREAVRVGAGVDVLSTTGVKDFVLQFDRVFESAFGFVRNYAIIESGLGPDGIYRVKIRAEVGTGTPDRQDTVALQEIVHRKKSPRVALQIDELIEGVPAGSDLVKGWLEQKIGEMQLQLVDLPRADYQSDKLAARDDLTGDAKAAAYRRAGIADKADFIIEAKVRGNFAGTEQVYGVPLNKISVSADLRAVRTDSGDVIASAPLPTWAGMSQDETIPGAARDILHRLLAGENGAPGEGSWSLFRRILAKWLTELDLGAIIRLEFKAITDAEFDRVIEALSANDKITAVWPREFDSAAFSFIDVESRLEAQPLKKAVTAALGDAFQYDRGTAHYLQFTRQAQAVVPTPQPTPLPGNGGGQQQVQPVPEPKKETSALPWGWIGAGAGLAIAGAVLLVLRKPKKNVQAPPPPQRVVPPPPKGGSGGAITSHDVFVSYAHDDEPRILPILERLRAAGVQTWRDAEAIRPGEDYADAIAHAIMGCRLLIVFLSHTSVSRDFVNNEIDFALDEKKPIIPLMIDPDVKLPPRLKLRLGAIQYVALSPENVESVFQRIVDELRKRGVSLERA